MASREVRPLTGWGLFLLPISRLFTRDRTLLDRRAESGRKYLASRQAERELQRELKKEAALFADLIQDCYTRLGEAHIPRHNHESADGRSRRKNPKVNKVQFEVCKTAPEVMHYKIKVRRRSMLRPWLMRNALPYGVFVGDLVRPETIRELEFALERKVGAIADDPRYGAWIQVFRLEGIGGLPRQVAYGDVLSKYPADMSHGTVVLGIGEHRAVHMVDIASHPHALIAGASGSGKSNMVNQLICSLLRFADPADLKFILIDLKRLEFSYYKRCGHLYKPIIVEAEDAIDTLQELLNEIKKRNKLLDERAKNVEEFNELYPNEKLPRLICVIDEFAELMMGSEATIAKEAERLVNRISNLGRAVGVHLWICTQRPITKVVSNAVKINMPLVLAGRTQNAAQSGTILGNGESAKLPLVPGRMIYQSGSQQHIIQTPLITTAEVREAISISAGRAAGLLGIEGIDPVLLKDKLVVVLAYSGGPLHEVNFEGLGVTPIMLRQFVKWVVATKEFTIDGESYALAGDKIVRVKLPGPPALSIVPQLAVPIVQAAPVDDLAMRRAAALEALRTIRANKAKESVSA